MNAQKGEKMIEVGAKIRAERRKKQLTLEALAKEVGISSITLQRIETGKSSPSVALLSEIAQYFNMSIYTFIPEIEKSFTLLKRKKQQTLSSSGLKIKLIGPRKMIKDHISVTYGELKKGKTIPLHSNPGIEYAYLMEGKCEHKMNGECIGMDPGDSLSYNARIEHEVTALEDMKFLAIFVRDEE